MGNKFIQQGLVTTLLVAGAMPILTRAQEASQAPAQGKNMRHRHKSQWTGRT